MMKKYILRCMPAIIAGAIIVGGVAYAKAAATGPADLILLDAKVKTPDGWEQALAVRDGIIIAVGKNKAVKKVSGENTEIIDLNGDTVLPGLHDMHVHGLFAGMEQFECRLKPSASPQEIADAVATCLAGKEPGEWVVGGNWVAAVFAPGEQNRKFLDDIASENPVLLNDESHHSVWVNSRALELAGITKDTPDPDGGIIERDANGEATGLLRESATGLVEHIMPAATEEERRRALTLSTNQMLSFGITSFTDASIRESNIGIYSDLSGEGIIKQRVRGCIVWKSGDNIGRTGGRTVSEKLIRAREHYSQPRYKLDCVKMFLDGVPTESRTGAMLEPYAPVMGEDGPEDTENRGILMIDQSILEKAVARFDRLGLSVKFHAAGDRAVRAALDAVAYTRQVNGWGGPKHQVGHSTFVSIDDIPRARELNVAWEFSPYIWYPTPIASVDILNVVGKKRMERWVPIRDAVETGALTVSGSDWSVVPSVNPWLAIETMVTREKPGGSKETLGYQERVSREVAFSMLTSNAAALMGNRNKVGSIEVGMRADVIVTDINPLQAPIKQVHRTKVKMTFIDGTKVFDASSPPKLSAH